MCAAWVSSSVHLPDFTRTTTFRWTLAIAGGFRLCTIVFSGFVYWAVAAYTTSRVDGLLIDELRVMAADTPEQRLEDIDDRLRQDPRRIRFAGLFGADGHYVAGNMETLPSGLAPDVPTSAMVVRLDNRGRERQNVRLTMRPLPNGEVLVVGRNIDEIADIAEIVGKVLALGMLPAVGPAAIIGMVLSSRAHDRLSEVNRRFDGSLQAICDSACRSGGPMTRSTGSLSASTGCWARSKLSSTRFPA